MILIRNSRERGRFMRFAVVGVIGAVVDFGVMNLLVSMFGMPFLYAGIISFICAILSNFTWNRYWTYPDSRSKEVRRQLIQFAIVSVIGLAIRIPILAIMEPALINLLESMFGISIMGLFTPEFIAHNVTLAFAVLVVMFWNFFANRYWTYSDVES